MRRRKNLSEATSSDEDEINIAEPDPVEDPVDITSRLKIHKKSGGRPGCSNTKEGDDYRTYKPLYKAAQRGDWESANAFFKENEDALTAKINAYSETALHVAVGEGTSSKSISFMKKLVYRMPPEALECRDKHGRTPFLAAVAVGNTEAVKFLWWVGINSQYRRAQFWSALYAAAESARKDILLFLLDVSENDTFSEVFPKEDSAAYFLIQVIASGCYDFSLRKQTDIASDLVIRYPRLATLTRANGDFGLKVLARKVSAFKSGSNHQGWQDIIYNLQSLKVTKEESTSHIKGDIEKGIDGPQVTRQRRNWARHLVEYFWTFVPCIKHIQDEKKMHFQALKLVKYLCERLKSQNNSDDADKLAKNALLTAAKFGIHEVIEAILESFPKLIWAEDEKGLNIFHIAIEKRHANVFNLIYRVGPNRELLVQMRDPFGNNLLHLAGKLAPRNKYNLVIGAALQMQRELQWFEV
ncbi:hypothetical protein RHGRI_033436 [Rhododendron griersonianum]|uniref:Ankyrin repeat family protein n=1 Tax=Rhododendron griersonianum TaxID=479676 RepID=A0AAV6HWP6_9ERIC|nr:hypothetical protein RHGRI_033436 [Rhododendron griersonianum]